MGTELTFRPGSFYRICERTGFATRADRTQKEWNGRIVRDASWEARQPQDLVKARPDRQDVPDPRPRPPDSFQGVQTLLTEKAAAGAIVLHVASILGFTAGARIGVCTDSGTFITTLNGAPAGLAVTLAAKLPFQASAGNAVSLWG